MLLSSPKKFQHQSSAPLPPHIDVESGSYYNNDNKGDTCESGKQNISAKYKQEKNKEKGSEIDSKHITNKKKGEKPACNNNSTGQVCSSDAHISHKKKNSELYVFCLLIATHCTTLFLSKQASYTNINSRNTVLPAIATKHTVPKYTQPHHSSHQSTSTSGGPNSVPHNKSITSKAGSTKILAFR